MYRIFLIDDDPLFCSVMAEALRGGHAEFSVETAATGEDAISLLAFRHFDAIISDYQMPGLNGIDLLKESSKVCPHTPVILVTGHGSTVLEKDALNHRAYAVLQKPVDRDVLYSVVMRAILRSQIVRRSLPSDLTPPEIHQRELTNESRRLSARISEVSQRLRQPLKSND